MHTETADGRGTKITKLIKKTKTCCVFVIFTTFVAFVEPTPWRVSGQAPQAAQQPPTQAQQRPVFRGGTHFVRVDAYPVQDGKIVEGLKTEDFEILEDGKPQTIESFDFITFDSFTPEAERQDPISQRAGFDLAADPRYRVFVVFVAMSLSSSPGAVVANQNLDAIQQPLVNFLERVTGPRDLFGFLTSRNSAKDLVLAQKTAVTVAQIKDLWRANFIDRDEADILLDRCDCGPKIPPEQCESIKEMLKTRFRADETYTVLTDLVFQLGSLRQERKNLVLATNLLPRWREDHSALNLRGPEVPRTGIANGRITTDERAAMAMANDDRGHACAAEFQRLSMLDFEPRYWQLLNDARRENVSFYVITPGGLQAPVLRSDQRAVQAANEDLRALAANTDGIAVVDTNDLNGGMRRIADDLSAYYLLGYYTTNTKFDGKIRKITVRLKKNGETIRARREYRAPTQAEIAAMASAAAQPASSANSVSPREAALTILERANRPFVPYVAVAGKTLTVVAELSAASIQAGRWKDGADVDVKAVGAYDEPLATAKGRIEAGAYSVAIPLTVSGTWPARVTIALRAVGERPADDWVKLEPSSGTLVGEAIAYRSGSRVAPRPVAGFEFARNERIRAEWPVLAPLDRREVRLLDRSGKPLPVELPLSEDPAGKGLVVEMSLSGLMRGDYLIDLTAGSGATIEHRLLPIRIKP